MKSNINRLTILIVGFVSMIEVANAFYDPGLQRWINRDPITENGGINLSAFTDNNSIARIDSYGECPALLIPLLWLGEGATALTATEAALLGGTAFGLGATAVAANTSIGLIPETGVRYNPNPTVNNLPPTIVFEPKTVPAPISIPVRFETKSWHGDSPNPDKTENRLPHRNRPDGKRDRPKDTTPNPTKPPEKPRPEFDINEDGTGSYPPSPCK